jgi:AraC family transcriptional regulator
MHRVGEFIDAHLDEALDLETLAKVAYFSPYHFHRLFSAWMGETLGDYLRRRRCEVAATRLVAQPRLSILEVALGVGFGSAEAFSRAFKLRFGESPSAWRLSNSSQTNRNLDQALVGERGKNLPSPRNLEFVMNVEIVNRKPTDIVYLRHLGSYGPSIGHFWQSTVYPWMTAHHLLGQPRYGISHDDPNVTAPDQCRYDAGCEMPEDFRIPTGAHKTIIPGGSYAVHTFKGTVAQIEGAWTGMLRDWLPSSGYQLDARPMFEFYPSDSRFDPATGVFDSRLCIPIAPL